MLIVYHANHTQPHQIEHGEWFKAGFKRHGLSLEITADIYKEADIHIVSGPHYAKRQWLNARTILLDKRYYREGPKPVGMASDPYVSLGWMTKTGHHIILRGEGRPPPEIGTNAGQGTIYLCEYGELPPQGFDTVRRHPDDEKSAESLTDALSRHKTAYGHNTTALIKAALMGLDTVCFDPNYIMNRPDWREALPYADWGYYEFDKAINHLWQQIR